MSGTVSAVVFDLGIRGPLNDYGQPSFETAFSWRDIILVVGGLFLIWKATKEIHHNVDPSPSDDLLDKKQVLRQIRPSLLWWMLSIVKVCHRTSAISKRWRWA